MTVPKTIPLSTIKKGQSCVIDSFTSDSLSIKLMEMGCLPGVTIKVSNIAPLGDPIAIEVSGYQLGIRKNEAKSVLVILS